MADTLPITTTEAVGIETLSSLIEDLNEVCAEIYDRWDKDQRSGKLLGALAGTVTHYNRAVTRIRSALALHDELVAALECAVSHVEHMAAWIGDQNAGYSFESLGEDEPSIRAALSRAKGQ
jgi:hypothetical protein